MEFEFFTCAVMYTDINNPEKEWNLSYYMASDP
jgi:hypothetical protein